MSDKNDLLIAQMTQLSEDLRETRAQVLKLSTEVYGMKGKAAIIGTVCISVISMVNVFIYDLFTNGFK